MSGPKNLLRIDDTHVKKLLTVARKPGKGVDSIPVEKLAKRSFKLLVFYVKLCELRSRPVVLSEIDDNALRII